MMLLLAGLVGAGPAWGAKGDRAAVTEALEAWVKAADARDADAVEALFTPRAVQSVAMGGKEMALPTPTYVQMIRDGKVGGGQTSLTIHDVSVNGGLATALTTRTTEALTMETAVVLERGPDGWLVSSARVMATPSRSAE